MSSGMQYRTGILDESIATGCRTQLTQITGDNMTGYYLTGVGNPIWTGTNYTGTIQTGGQNNPYLTGMGRSDGLWTGGATGGELTG